MDSGHSSLYSVSSRSRMYQTTRPLMVIGSSSEVRRFLVEPLHLFVQGAQNGLGRCIYHRAKRLPFPGWADGPRVRYVERVAFPADGNLNSRILMSAPDVKLVDAPIGEITDGNAEAVASFVAFESEAICAHIWIIVPQAGIDHILRHLAGLGRRGEIYGGFFMAQTPVEPEHARADDLYRA